MRNRLFTKSLALLAGLMLFGCFYDVDRDKVDMPYEEDQGGDTDTDTDSDADSDADGGETEPSGYGEECDDDGECADYDADYCMKNPMAPADPGACTIKDCEPGNCPEDSQCCDCTSSLAPQLGVFCITDDQVSEVASAGCNCS